MGDDGKDNKDRTTVVRCEEERQERKMVRMSEKNTRVPGDAYHLSARE